MTARILVVDDELPVRTLLSRVLVQQGFDVISAVNGREALAMTVKDRPDLVVLDLNLPDLHGENICQTIRLNPDTERIPVLILTGKPLEGLSVRCLNGGADDYLPKPFDVEEILAHIRALLRRSKGQLQNDEVLTRGRLTIRVAERRVFWKGALVETLAPKEFEVLRFLVARSPRVVDKNALALQAWGSPYEELHQRTLDVHIRRLRKKLGSVAAGCLKTVPSVGFQWFDETLTPSLSPSAR